MTFGFDRISARANKGGTDLKIRLTITHHVINFFTENHDKVLFFVCDSADSREIHCSLILHTENVLKAHIISCFRSLSKSTTEKLRSY